MSGFAVKKYVSVAQLIGCCITEPNQTPSIAGAMSRFRQILCASSKVGLHLPEISSLILDWLVPKILATSYILSLDLESNLFPVLNTKFQLFSKHIMATWQFFAKTRNTFMSIGFEDAVFWNNFGK